MSAFRPVPHSKPTSALAKGGEAEYIKVFGKKPR